MKEIPESFVIKYVRAVLALAFVISFASLSAQQHPQGYGLLWEISGNGLQHPSYLYGSIHIRHKDVFDFPDSLFCFIERCDAFASEVELDSSMMLLFSTVFSEEYQAYDHGHKAVIPTHTPYLPSVQKAYQPPRRKLEPVMYTMLDAYLHGLAKSQGKCIYGLEDIREHMQLDELVGSKRGQNPWEFGIGMKEQTVEEIRNIYISGELDSIYNFVSQYGGIAEYEDLVRRNNIMLASMKAIMLSQSLFTVVGAAHLPGEQGLISLLQNAGFSMRQVVPTYTGLTQSYSYLPVEETWYHYSSSDSLLGFDAPIDMVSVDRRSADEYWTGFDLGAGIGYNVAAVFQLPGRRVDWQGHFFDPKMYTLLRENSIVHNGQVGKEFWLIRQHDDLRYFRAWLFEVGGRLYFIHLAAFAEEKLRSATGTRFLESLQLPGPSSALQPMIVPGLHCKLVFPRPAHRQIRTTASGEKSLLMRACDQQGNYYAFRTAFVVAETPDSIQLTTLAATEFDYFQLAENQQQLTLGASALTATAAVKLSASDSLHMKIFKDGNRLYMLVAAGKNIQKAFFDDFQWLPVLPSAGEKGMLTGIADSIYWPVGGLVTNEEPLWVNDWSQLLPIERKAYELRTDAWSGVNLSVLAVETESFASIEAYDTSLRQLLALVGQSAKVMYNRLEYLPNGLSAECELSLKDRSTICRLSLHWEGRSCILKVAQGSVKRINSEQINKFLSQPLSPLDIGLVSHNLVLQQGSSVLRAWLSPESGWSDTRESLLCNYPFTEKDIPVIIEALNAHHWLEGSFVTNLLRIRLAEVVAGLDEQQCLQLLQQLWSQPQLQHVYAGDYLQLMASLSIEEASISLSNCLQQLGQPYNLQIWRLICARRPDLFFKHIQLWESTFTPADALVFWKMAIHSLDAGASIATETQAWWLSKVQKGLDYKQDTTLVSAVLSFIDTHAAEIPGVDDAVKVFWKKPVSAALSVRAAHYLLRRDQWLHPDKISKLLADSITFWPMVEVLNDHDKLGKLEKGVSWVEIAQARLLAALPADRLLRSNPVFYQTVIYKSRGHKYKAFVFRLPLAAGKGFGLAAVGGFDLRGKRQGWEKETTVLFDWEEVTLLEAAGVIQAMLGMSTK